MYRNLYKETKSRYKSMIGGSVDYELLNKGVEYKLLILMDQQVFLKTKF